MQTKVSVIIPSNSDERSANGYLLEAMQSVKKQSLEGIQILVRKCDASTSRNINVALMQAEGEFVKIMGDDDTLPENCLRDLYDGIKGYDFLCANAQLFGDESMIYCSRPQSLKGLLNRNTLHGGTMLYRREMLLEVGGFDENLICAEEYDLHLNLLQKGYKLGYIPTVVYNYRVHKDQKNIGMSRHRRYVELEAIRNRYR